MSVSSPPPGHALVPCSTPITMAGVLLAHQEQDPQLRTRTYLAALRHQLVLLLNATRSSLKEDKFNITPPRETTNFEEKVIPHLQKDFCLGASYIEKKKGWEGLHTYLAKPDLITPVKAGKKLRAEGLHVSFSDIMKNNSVLFKMTEVADSEFNTFVVSDIAHELLNYDVVKNISHIDELQAVVAQAEEAFRILQFAASYGVNASTTQKTLDTKGLQSYFETLGSLTRGKTGLAEIAMFNRCFCHVHAQPWADPFTMPKELWPAFRTAFEWEADWWSIKKDAQESLMKAARDLHPAEQDIALKVLAEGLNFYQIALSQRGVSTVVSTKPEDGDKIFKLVFPNVAVARESKGFSLRGVKGDSEITKERYRQRLCTVPITKNVEEILAMKTGEFLATVRDTPFGACWYPIIQNSSIQILRQLVDKLLLLDTHTTKMLAAELLFFKLYADPTFDKEMVLENTMIEDFDSTSPLVQSIPDEELTWAMDMIAGNTDKVPSILPTAEDAFEYLTHQEYFPSVFYSEHWIDSQKTSENEALTLAVVSLKETEARSLPMTVEFLAAQCKRMSRRFWSDLTKELFDSLPKYPEAGDSLLMATGLLLQKLPISNPEHFVPPFFAYIIGSELTSTLSPKRNDAALQPLSDDQMFASLVDFPLNKIFVLTDDTVELAPGWAGISRLQSMLFTYIPDKTLKKIAELLRASPEQSVVALFPVLHGSEKISLGLTSQPLTNSDVSVLSCVWVHNHDCADIIRKKLQDAPLVVVEAMYNDQLEWEKEIKVSLGMFKREDDSKKRDRANLAHIGGNLIFLRELIAAKKAAPAATEKKKRKKKE